ncbi:DUF2490 domain-containing protein [Penaeicola halotolerans]|uniref:DUF2490 domain-containing protein n=1 Tax=Penaeicola halotolerans TaxID=2793196 RepID=UPI001CF8995C|nr:DUF2490 domain-containing protein [Penaeicola halotolerans]
MKKLVLLLILGSLVFTSQAQTAIDEEQPGAWYMYFFTKKFEKSRFGIQGDYQFRYWDFGSDKEQILLRTGITYKPKKADILFTLGYGFISSGAFGESTENVIENRIYQEALIPQRIGSRFLLTHRFRYEQRWVDGQDFRTRYRYNLFLNIPLNATDLKKKTVYIALYNELFINGQRGIGDGRSVEIFDRNRAYGGLGYGLKNNLRMQLGWMNQTTDDISKGQAQVSLHHTF